MDALVACWIVVSFLVVLVSIGVCWWVTPATPKTPGATPPDPFAGPGVYLFLGFGMLGVIAYVALAYWLGRAGGFWAVAGIVVVVLLSTAGCLWVIRVSRKAPTSFDGYPFIAFIVVGISALVALAQGLG